MLSSVINRVGGKARIASHIISHLPPHQSFTEVFAGSGIITLRKPPAEVNEVLNDKDGRIANLFRVLRDDPDELARRIAFTPYSRQVFQEAQVRLMDPPSADDPITSAVDYVVCNRQGWFGTPPVTWSVSRRPTSRLSAWNKLPDVVLQMAQRLKNAYIECLDYRDCLQKHDGPEYCHYLDPPYLDVEGKYYEVNRSDGFDHEALRASLDGVQGSVVVSYYDSPYVRDLYKGFQITKLPTHTTINPAKQVTELLLIRPSQQPREHAAKPVVVPPTHIRQPPLFPEREAG